MADPAKIAFGSPFDSFKNNDYKTASVTASGSVAPTSLTRFTTTVPLDRDESVTDIYFTTTANSIYHNTGRTYVLLPDTSIYHNDGDAPPGFSPATYNIDFENIYGSSELTLSLSIASPFPDPLVLVSETINFEVYTFIGPFRSA